MTCSHKLWTVSHKHINEDDVENGNQIYNRNALRAWNELNEWFMAFHSNSFFRLISIVSQLVISLLAQSLDSVQFNYYDVVVFFSFLF